MADWTENFNVHILRLHLGNIEVSWALEPGETGFGVRVFGQLHNRRYQDVNEAKHVGLRYAKHLLSKDLLVAREAEDKLPKAMLAEPQVAKQVQETNGEP